MLPCCQITLGKGEAVKIITVAFSAIVLASGFSPLALAQVQFGVPGVGEVTVGRLPRPLRPLTVHRRRVHTENTANI